MSIQHLSAVLLSALAAGSAMAQLAPPAVQAPGTAVVKPTGDYQDLIFCASTRPVLMRVHVQVDGKPYTALWDAYVDRLFKFLDRNGDGVLSKEEAAHVPSAQFLQQNLQGGIGGMGPQNIANFNELDVAPKDGKVSKAELAQYYSKTGMAALRITTGSDQGTSEKLTEALFKHLDLNKDGKLSREELAAAETSLHRLDLDEDEMVTTVELAPDLFNRQFFGEVAYPGGMRRAGPQKAAFLTINPAQPAAQLAQQLLLHYDKDKNKKLSLQEIGLDKAAFDRLDKNHDGQLDEKELAQLASQPIDLELIVRLGPMTDLATQISQKLFKSDFAADLYSPGGKKSPLASAARKVSDGALQITLGDGQIDFRRTDTGFNGVQNIRQFYLQRFRAIDANNKGYIEKKDVSPNDGNNQFLLPLFDVADIDSDGKLTLKEFNAYFDVQAFGASSFITLTTTEFGRGMFELLDTNNDGRLGIRELRSAWARLSPWDKDGDGRIARTEVPYQFRLTVNQGQPNNAGRFNVFNFNATPRTISRKGPLWFQRMDRNGDGDVSFREFLGSREEFDQIDTDHDGLISLEEAQRAEATFRAGLAKKR